MTFLTDLFLKVVEWIVAKFIVGEIHEEIIKESSHNDAEKLATAKSDAEKAKALEDVIDHINPKP